MRAMWALMLVGFAAAQALWQLFLFRTLHGLFAANISTAQAYMADITPPEGRAKAMVVTGSRLQAVRYKRAFVRACSFALGLVIKIAFKRYKTLNQF